MGLTSEELQLIEQAVENEIHNINKVIERSLDHRKEEWIIKQRRLAIALRTIQDDLTIEQARELLHTLEQDNPKNEYFICLSKDESYIPLEGNWCHPTGISPKRPNNTN